VAIASSIDPIGSVPVASPVARRSRALNGEVRRLDGVMTEPQEAHSHRHEHDRGVAAMLRYLRWAPTMWSSDVNAEVIELVAPAEGELVVDVGAGMGPATVLAARAGASVVAVEPTPFMRSILKTRRLFSRSRDKITIVDGGAEKISVDDDSVDALWAVNTMHHWVDPERAAAEIARVLRPGGRVVLVDEDFADPTHPEYERFGSKHEAGGDGDDGHGEGDGDEHHHGFEMVDATRIGRLLEAEGLTDVVAGTRTLADRPVIAVTAAAPSG
jgi:SAM-dependent methyltransferase